MKLFVYTWPFTTNILSKCHKNSTFKAFLNTFLTFKCKCSIIMKMKNQGVQMIFGYTVYTTDPWKQKKHRSMHRASTKHLMEGFSQHNSSLIGRKNQAKLENDFYQEVGIDSKLLNQS